MTRYEKMLQLTSMPNHHITPEWIARVSRHLHFYAKSAPVRARYCERRLYRTVLKAISSGMAEDVKCCAFTAIDLLAEFTAEWDTSEGEK
jgi:hypothetical protein